MRQLCLRLSSFNTRGNERLQVEWVAVTSIIQGFRGPLGKSGRASKPTMVNTLAIPNTVKPMVVKLKSRKPKLIMPSVKSAAFFSVFMIVLI